MNLISSKARYRLALRDKFNSTLNGKNMQNPIEIDDGWNFKAKENLGEDRLVVYQKKEVECLVE